MFIGESEVKVNRLYHFCNFLILFQNVTKQIEENYVQIHYPEIAIDNVF